jgi:hypothetical protein
MGQKTEECSVSTVFSVWCRRQKNVEFPLLFQCDAVADTSVAKFDFKGRRLHTNP